MVPPPAPEAFVLLPSNVEPVTVKIPSLKIAPPCRAKVAFTEGMGLPALPLAKVRLSSVKLVPLLIQKIRVASLPLRIIGTLPSIVRVLVIAS